MSATAGSTRSAPVMRAGAAGKEASHPQWSVQTRHDDAALAGLRAEWDDLYARCGSATGFVSHAWLDSWWRSYGRAGRLVVVLVRRRNRLVAAAALARHRRAGVAVLSPLGAGISDFSDVLIDDSSTGSAAHSRVDSFAGTAGAGDGAQQDEAAGRLARAMAAQNAVVDLPEVAPDAAVWRVVRAWPRRTWQLPASMCLEVPGRPLDELISALPGRTARGKRRKLRKIDQERIDQREVDVAGAADAVAALLALHREQWRGRAMSREHGRARFVEHLARAATAMVGRGEAALVEYRKDGVLLGVDMLIVGRTMVGGYLTGVRRELSQRVDVTALLLRQNLDLTVRLGRRTLSLLRGDEEHKLGWRPTRVPNRRVLLAGSHPLAAAGYAAAVRARADLARALRTRLPGLHHALKRVRAW